MHGMVAAAGLHSHQNSVPIAGLAAGMVFRIACNFCAPPQARSKPEILFFWGGGKGKLRRGKTVLLTLMRMKE